MKKISIPVHLAVACAFLYCLVTLYNGSSVQAVYTSYNIFMLPVLLGLTFVLHKGFTAFCNLSKRRFIFVICGVLFAIFFVFGTQVMLNGAVTLQSAFLWICILLFSYVLTAFVVLLFTYALPALQKFFNEHSYPALDKLYSKLNFPLFWLLIFVCWLPTLLACYPGIFSYDAIYQSSQVTDTLQLNTHHPIIHTLFLGGCVQLGRSVFGNANTGMLFYSLIQMLINSAIFAYILTFLKKHAVTVFVQVICFAFFAFVPFNSLFAICATKDSIFSTLFVLLFTIVLSLVLDTTKFFTGWKSPCLFSLTVFLLLIFRNNMLYAFILCIPFLLWIYRKHWKKAVLMLVAPILLLLLYEGMVYPALHVTSGNSREAYSVIMQQYANVYNNCELEASDKEQLLAIMPDESWKKYEPHKSDAIKNDFNTEVFEENLVDYMKLWVKLGVQNPSQYVNAFLNLTYGYWYPNDALPDTTTYRKYIEVYTGGDITFESKLPWLLEKIERFGMESSYQSIPGLSMLFSPAAYLWLLLFLCAVNFYNKNWKFFIPLLLPATLFLTLLLGPVALLRYFYPIMLCVPVICALYGKLTEKASAGLNDTHNAEAL